MKLVKLAICSTIFLFAIAAYGDSKGPGGTLPGTDTAPVRISLDRKGVPSVDVDPVILKVGQRVVFVGPTKYAINFPEDSPFSKHKFRTNNAVINLVIPEQSKDQRKKGVRRTKFKYEVIVGSIVLDPHMIIEH